MFNACMRAHFVVERAHRAISISEAEERRARAPARGCASHRVMLVWFLVSMAWHGKTKMKATGGFLAVSLIRSLQSWLSSDAHGLDVVNFRWVKRVWRWVRRRSMSLANGLPENVCARVAAVATTIHASQLYKACCVPVLQTHI